MATIHFFVNNSGLSDVRVVKTAEVLAEKGHQAIVFGCDGAQSGVSKCVRNKVTYVILPLKSGFVRGCLANCLVRPYLWYRKVFSSVSLDEISTTTGARTTEPPAVVDVGWMTATQLAEQAQRKPEMVVADTSSDIELRGFKKQIGRALGLGRMIVRLPRRLHAMLRKRAVNALHPSRSTFGVRSLFGNYLRTFSQVVWVGQPDVVYCHEIWTLQIGSLVCARTPSATFVYDSHELEEHRNNNWQPNANRARLLYESANITAVDHVVTVCDSISQYLADRYGIERPLVLPNSPLLRAIREVPEDRRLRSMVSLTQSDLLAVYTGKLTTGRGLADAVRLVSRVPEASIAFVGPRVESVCRDLAVYACSLSMGNRVFFVDPVHHELLVSFISDANIALVPIENVCLSYYYSLPNKIFEAAMAGVPALCSDLPELRGFVQENDAGEVVDFQDQVAAEAKFRTLVTKETPRAKVEALRQQHTFENALGRVAKRLGL